MTPANWSIHGLIMFFLNPWVLIGFFGQFLFFMRFIIQWLASEKKGQVVVPVAFWYLSIAGTLVILGYAIHIKDLVFTVAQVLSLFIYARNLSFLRKVRLQEEAAQGAAATPNIESTEPA